MQKSLSISDGRLRKARLYSTTETIILPFHSPMHNFPIFPEPRIKTAMKSRTILSLFLGISLISNIVAEVRHSFDSRYEWGLMDVKQTCLCVQNPEHCFCGDVSQRKLGWLPLTNSKFIFLILLKGD